MSDNITSFLTKGLWVVILIFLIRCVISMPTSAYDCIGYAGEAISGSLIVLGLYERIIWKYNPFEKLPSIAGKYSGNIEYSYNGKYEKKKASIIIKQSLLTAHVQITTNEIVSSTITSNVVFENNEYVLYYTYITNPKSKYSKENPIQYGTCRVIMKNCNELQGVYWTTRQTIGDITLKKPTKKCK